MPRPPIKRKRSNQRSPSRRVANVNSAQVRQQLDRKLKDKIIGDRPIDSDDSDRLVTRRSGTRGRPGSARGDIFASGAVAKGDKPGAHPSRAQIVKNVATDTRQVIAENRAREERSKSASKSKSASPRPTKSRLNNVQTNDDDGGQTSSAAIEVRRSATKSPDSALPKSRTVPTGETSVLGTLKPRKRQASILHLIDNNDSTIINSDDEEQFLPDDESTPLNTNKNTVARSSSSSSRKRKLGSDEPILVTNGIKAARTTVTSSPLVRDSLEPVLPAQVQSSSKRPRRSQPVQIHSDDDDIMAPPQSSSPEPSPQKSRESLVKKTKPTKVAIPSTAQLQSLMPSKQKESKRKRKPVSEFDIPEDESSDPANENEDNSVFMPHKRTVKGSKKDASSKSGVSRAKVTGNPGKSATKPKSKSTSTTPATPRISSIRTPLPLTRSINAENRKLRSPSSLQTTAKKIQSVKQKLADPKTPKQSGGSLPVAHSTRTTRQTRRTAAMNDKENQDSTNLGLAPALLPGRIGADDEPVATEDDGGIYANLQDSVRDSIEIEAEVGRKEQDKTLGYDDSSDLSDLTSIGEGDSADSRNGSREAKTWKDKWADIDKWEMEFEEVEVSTEGNSPMHR